MTPYHEGVRRKRVEDEVDGEGCGFRCHGWPGVVGTIEVL